MTYRWVREYLPKRESWGYVHDAAGPNPVTYAWVRQSGWNGWGTLTLCEQGCAVEKNGGVFPTLEQAQQWCVEDVAATRAEHALGAHK